MMAWVAVFLASLCEAAWATMLSLSDGLTKLKPSVGFVIFAAVSYVGIVYAVRHLPIGPVYAVWTGTGTTLTALIGMIWLGDPVVLWTFIGITLIVVGVVMINLAVNVS